jgi:hypothetical protein
MTRHEGALKVLYLPLYEWGYRVELKQKRGLREALARRARVVEINWRWEYGRQGLDALLGTVTAALEALRPDLVLAQVHDARVLNAGHIRRLRRRTPGAVWLNWNGDYQDVPRLPRAELELAGAFDAQLVVSFDGAEQFRRRGIASRYWQVSWEPDGVGHEPTWRTRRNDVLLLANNIPWYPARRELVAALRRAGFRFGLYGRGWPLLWARGHCYYDFAAGCRLIRAAKVVLADNPRPYARGYVSNRLFHSLAAGGALVMLERFLECERLGFVDGRHLIIWNDRQDLMEKLEHWLRPKMEAQRRAVARAGRAFCLNAHSFDVRVGELLELFDALRRQHTRPVAAAV